MTTLTAQLCRCLAANAIDDRTLSDPSCEPPNKRMHRSGRKTGFVMVNHSRPSGDPER